MNSQPFSPTVAPLPGSVRCADQSEKKSSEATCVGVPARRSLVAIERCTGAWILILSIAFLAISALLGSAAKAETLRYHTLVLDDENKILPWYTPIENAYDHYLDQLWTWLPTVPKGPGSSLPMYFLYCGFRPGNPITPDSWENDWGERIPNFVEFGRLYYAYTGDMAPLDIARSLADYALAHGMTPANYAWPNFPYGTANAGSTEINGDNVAWNQDDILIDLGSDMGMSFYTLYLVYGTPAYRDAAIKIADTLSSKIKVGDANNSPWPYVVNARTGSVQSPYTSNFAGALTLFDLLIGHGEPNAATYAQARQTLKNWILNYPMKNGNWVDGHSDVWISGTGNWSNTTKSNMNLYLFDNPGFDPNFQIDAPKLLEWTEDNFVSVRTSDGLYGSTGQYYGAYVVAEQFAYMMRMGYQTARQAAEYAEWYAVSGDETYKDKAYRGFNYSTYMMKSNGESSDGPTDSVGFWWGDVYGEGPRMFFHGFKAVPEWAPPRENHILYSKTVLKNVAYTPASVAYTATDNQGTEYLRLAFYPDTVMVGGTSLPFRGDLIAEGYTVRALGGGDYAVTIRRERSGNVVVSGEEAPTDTTPPTVSLSAPTSGATVSGTVTISANASDPSVAGQTSSGIAGVQFKLDGANLGPEDTTSPYAITWDTTTATNGSHTLTAAARDAAGNATTSSVVTVTVSNIVTTPPSITSQPASQTATVGSTATFSVVAAGTPPFSYQWQKNGANVPGATASSYTTPALALADSGSTYRVTVTNGAGSVTSNAATLTVTQGPLPSASYNMDEGSGTTLIDRSGNNRTGTLTNGPIWTAGKNIGGLSFDGSNDYVTLGTQTLTAQFTLSAWVNNPTVQTYESLFSFGTNRQFSITQGSLAYWSGSGSEYRFGAVPTGSWNHVAFTYDGTSLRAYLNGAPLGNALTQSITATSGLTFLGAWPTTSNTPNDFFSGILDDVRFYNVALTQAQLQTDMNTPVGGVTFPDTTPPTISLIQPGSGATVSGAVTVSANASDASVPGQISSGIAGVQFKLDGANLGAEDRTSPYAITWDTTTATNGSHTLTAVARDVVGNTALSSGVTVNVSNTVTTLPSTSTFYSDAFESSVSWTTSGSVDWYTGTPHNGTHSVRLSQTGSITKTIPTTGYTNIAVSFTMGAYSLDSGEYVLAEYYNGISWVSLARIDNGSANENQRLNPYAFTLPSPVNNLSSFALSFRIVSNSTRDYGYVDDVAVRGTR
jgi:hypothetical protein